MLIVDFAPHELEFLREQFAHERLGISVQQVGLWLADCGLELIETRELVPDHELIGEPYFPVYRRIITLISVPPQPYRRSSVVKANVRLADILASHRLDQIGAAATDRVVIQTASIDFHGR